VNHTPHRIPRNFCGLSPEFSSWEHSRAVIIPVPYDLTSTYVSGSRRGPEAIIAASMNMEQFDEELRVETFRAGIHTQDQLEPTAASPEGMIAAIEQSVGQVAASGKLPVMLGGEHSITVGALRALRKRHRKLSILQLDAHADLRDSYQGTPLSHACAGRRASEMGKLVQAGIRSLSAPEERFRAGSSVTTFFAADIAAGHARPQEIVAELGEELYITIDLDVLDPAYMPATGTPEPGGLTWYQLLGILRAACEGRRVVGFDVVELCPIAGNVAPDFLAAKLVYRLLGYIFTDTLATMGREKKNDK
jgi:agmatinase